MEENTGTEKAMERWGRERGSQKPRNAPSARAGRVKEVFSPRAAEGVHPADTLISGSCLQSLSVRYFVPPWLWSLVRAATETNTQV